MRVEPNPSNLSDGASDKTTVAANRQRSRALLFKVLSGLWVFPSFGAGWILWMDPAPWQTSLTLAERFEAISVEQWCAIALLLAHGLFAILAWPFRRTEQPKAPSNQT